MTLRCKRCGHHIPLTVETGLAEALVTIEDHDCDRVLVAECWEAGEVIAVCNSDHPGVTGPEDLISLFAIDADTGWRPPPDDGWTYRWQS